MPSPSGKHYCSEHRAIRRKLDTDRKYCGVLFPVYQQYETYADCKYADSALPKHVVRAFLGSLQEQEVTDINAATVDHIGQYIAGVVAKGGAPRPDFVKVFFDYLINERIYRQQNPVRSQIHYQRMVRNAPRPYLPEEVKKMWGWLDKRGNTEQHAIFALALQSGPEPAEICNIRVCDVFTGERRVWFRNPDQNVTGGLYSHWAPFGKEAAFWLEKWIKERPRNCDHDRFFLNAHSKPLQAWSLKDTMDAVLLRKSKFREYSDGLDHFCLRRMRETNIWMLRIGGMHDSENMRMHHMLAVASIKRFDRLMTAEEVQQHSVAVDAM